ncbi:MAG TPA: transposase [Myxococcaceae bacterium]|nr:transposase [Myxococcaceae bacterium]
MEALLAASLQRRLPLTDTARPHRQKPRCSFLEGFSLHANTRVHAHDRASLERLCRYGARGPLALERLSWREDGRLSYRLKRPAPDGSTHLVLTPLQLLRLLAALVPPPLAHLVHFHGVLAPNARLRPLVVPKPPPPSPPPCAPPPAAALASSLLPTPTPPLGRASTALLPG